MVYEARRARFHALHESGCFAIPNPWDAGTARVLEQLGFKALATTSAGFAFANGLPDTADALDVDAALGHIAEIVAATDLPVNADFQAGYADDAEGVAANVRRCVETGVAGLSIEDTRPDGGLFELDEAVERVRAAADAVGPDVLLTARAECFLHKHPDALSEAILRLQAFAEAGADVLYAPGVTDRESIKQLVASVSPKPLNVLVGGDVGLRIGDLAELGVRRVSVGSAFARAAWGAFLRSARELADDGGFTELSSAAPFAELNAMFS
ncbi:MAG: isocitrate lyase/PEP mutase family protein [Solirubrobacterales bacterium]